STLFDKIGCRISHHGRHAARTLSAIIGDLCFCSVRRVMSPRSVLATVVVVWISSLSVAFAQIHGPVEVTAAVHHDVSEELRKIPRKPPQPGQRVIPAYHVPHALLPDSPDPVLQTKPGATTAAPVSGLNFDGVGQGFSGPGGSFTPSGVPPDTNGA